MELEHADQVEAFFAVGVDGVEMWPSFAGGSLMPFAAVELVVAAAAADFVADFAVAQAVPAVAAVDVAVAQDVVAVEVEALECCCCCCCCCCCY